MDTEFVTVYRLEHKTLNTGPWNSMAAHYNSDMGDEDALQRVFNFIQSRINCLDFPSINIDVAFNEVGWSWVCGCESIEILRKWFAHGDLFVMYLQSAGFIIRQFHVPAYNVRRGRSGLQVIFDPLDCNFRNLPLTLLSDDYSDSVQAEAA